MIFRPLTNQVTTRIQKLLPSCEGDIDHAKRQLTWLKEKIIQDRDHKQSGLSTISKLSQEEEAKLDKYIDQRVKDNKPLQYILGTQPFCELDIVTRPPTLIPRWETEEWTNKVIQILRPQLTSGTKRNKKVRILDICTGSGCIALSLAKHLPKDSVEIVGLDISTEAIDLANHNLKVHQEFIQNSVEFRLQDVFSLDLINTPSDCYNLIVSNPPYVTPEEYKTLDPDVKEWEDIRALVAEDQGTKVHKRIIKVAKHCTRPFDNIHVPSLFMEIGGAHQIETLTHEFHKHDFKHVEVWKDLANKSRVITGQQQ